MKTSHSRKPLEYYLSLKYVATVYPDEKGYVAKYKDLPGCITQSGNKRNILDCLDEAKELWIRTAYEFGTEIPEPSPYT